MTSFLGRGREILDSSVWNKISLSLCRRIDNEFLSGCVSNRHHFSSGVEINLNFCVRDRIWLGFVVGIESEMFSVREIDIDLVRAEINYYCA